jgi:hypothetical protein
MGAQTDGVEWVLATLFCLAILLVVGAGIREIRKMRKGDPGGDIGPGKGPDGGKS